MRAWGVWLAAPPWPWRYLPNAAAVAALLLSGMFEAGTAGADVTASAGANIILSASGSTDANGDTISYSWSIASKPNGSNAELHDFFSAQASIKPDLGGTCVTNLRVTDSKGAYSEKKAQIEIKPNVAPVTNIAVKESFTGVNTVKPTQALNVGSAAVLDANGVTDADGDVVITLGN